MSLPRCFVGIDQGRPFTIFSSPFLTRLRFRQLNYLIVVELCLKVLAVTEEVEKLEGGLIRVDYALCYAGILQLFEETMPASASAFDLNEVSGREDRPKQTEVQNICTVIPGGHHANSHAHPRLAGTVSRHGSYLTP